MWKRSIGKAKVSGVGRERPGTDLTSGERQGSHDQGTDGVQDLPTSAGKVNGYKADTAAPPTAKLRISADAIDEYFNLQSQINDTEEVLKRFLDFNLGNLDIVFRNGEAELTVRFNDSGPSFSFSNDPDCIFELHADVASEMCDILVHTLESEITRIRKLMGHFSFEIE